MLKEDPHMTTVGLHQLHDVTHDRPQLLGRIAPGLLPLPLTCHQQRDELIMNLIEKLILTLKIVIKRRLGDTDRSASVSIDVLLYPSESNRPAAISMI